MNYFDAFSGAGGFSLGLIKAGFEFDWHGYSEIDKYALSVYKRRFPDATRFGSVKFIQPDELPELDLVTFGFPCQDLSVSGKRAGLGGKRSSLFFEAMRIIRAKRPSYFIFENVKGLYTANKGKDFIKVLQEIADSGYDGQWQLLNTRWFLPQNRERIYFVGHLRNEPRPEIFPIREDETMDYWSQGKTQTKGSRFRNHNSQSRKIANTISSRYYKDGAENLIEETPIMIHNVYGGFNETTPRVFNKYSPTIRTPKGGGHLPYVVAARGRNKTDKHYQQLEPRKDGVTNSLTSAEKDNWIMLTEARTEEAKEERKKSLEKGKDWCPRRGKQLVPRKDDTANCVTANPSNEHYMMNLQDREIRRLTPEECERLQGFMWPTKTGWSEPWTKEGKNEEDKLIIISNTQRYKMMGNAVSIPVVQVIGLKLKRYLSAKTRKRNV
jgi:DNA (cytosine-5)-methyltransferase 1